MAGSGYSLRFWGVRGTIPSPSASMLRYGGNTPCVAAALSEDEYLILDCGSGMRLLGREIARRRNGSPTKFRVFFSHYHLDHIEGLPLFQPLYDPSSRFSFHGFEPQGQSLRQVLETYMAPPYFPVRLENVPSSVEYLDAEGRSFQFGDVRVTSLPLHHPDGSLSYRIDHGDCSVVYATDHEHGVPEIDEALSRFAHGVDYLIYDATYQQTEYERLRRGWGHSTWYAAIQAARNAEAKTLVLFHHHTEHTDDDLDQVLRVAREEFPRTEIAREGMELPF